MCSRAERTSGRLITVPGVVPENGVARFDAFLVAGAVAAPFRVGVFCVAIFQLERIIKQDFRLVILRHALAPPGRRLLECDEQ